ncbi:MAG: helix-turn-helix domain-containing protein [Acidisphaera sp.]|nr:helix-turn-helix domain-containing protein [Acidisphaera sp.]
MSTRTIRRWLERGELRFHRLGRQHRVSEEDLIAFLARNRR